MGNIAETKLNIKHRNFVDYPFSKIKSDFRCFFSLQSFFVYLTLRAMMD